VGLSKANSRCPPGEESPSAKGRFGGVRQQERGKSETIKKMNIQILEIRFMKGEKAVRGFADVRMDDITIKDFRIYHQNGKPTVRNPFSTYKDTDGSLKFRETISLPPNVKAEIDALIVTEYFRRLKEQNNGRESG
jgi:hypothetical protein